MNLKRPLGAALVAQSPHHSFRAAAMLLASLLVPQSRALAQLGSPDVLFIVGVFAAKNKCVAAYPEIADAMGKSVETLISRNSSFSRDQWLTFEKASFPGPAPSKVECTNMVSALATTDFDPAIVRMREAGTCMQQVRGASERSGPTRASIGVELANTVNALVDVVVPSGPASVAGLAVGDVVVRYGEATIQSPCELALGVLRSGAAQPIPVTVLRRGERIQLTITPQSVPND